MCLPLFFAFTPLVLMYNGMLFRFVKCKTECYSILNHKRKTECYPVLKRNNIPFYVYGSKSLQNNRFEGFFTKYTEGVL